MFIDTHTHLFSDAFDDDRKEVVQRAIDAGVEKMLLPNIDIASIDAMHKLCREFPDHCFPMMGIHPGSVNENWEEDLNHVYSYLKEGKYVAVGEIGMDLYWDKTFLEEQKQAFEQQVIWAKEFQLPIVIHAREAFDEIFSIVDRHNDAQLTGVFHCFTGTSTQAKRILEYGGFKLGIGGVLTYKKAKLEESLEHVPLSELVLETDAPYLSPTPYRGKRNESAYVVFVAERLADIYGVSLMEVEEVTTKSTVELFKLSR